MTSIQVAVRVRPFNNRELKYQSVLVVDMKGKYVTELRNLHGGKLSESSPPRKFNFDYCFWTHSRDLEYNVIFPTIDPLEANDKIPESVVYNQNGPIYANQEYVYNQIGLPILNNALKGFNACLFAYGQTGSGKTYSMMGVPSDPGVIPKLCRDLFARSKDAKGSSSMQVSVTCSYLEIYNENVRDLLNPVNMDKSMRVRQHPTLGVYVEDLTKLVVFNEEEIVKLLEDGSKVRHVAATSMNVSSSRSHAILTLSLVIKSNSVEVGSSVNLVDLAGSERLSTTGAEGERLVEGANINKSLTTLGMCLSRLAEAAEGKSSGHIPYRDSQLTWILNESLGGNSKTAMLANISPASINYEETLSTLRFAMTVKKIKNHAVINEDPQQRIIRELRAEIEDIKKKITELETGGVLTLFDQEEGDEMMTAEEKEEAQLEALEQATKLLEEAAQGEAEKKKREAAAKAEHERAMAAFQRQVIVVDSSMPRLVTLNEDLHAFSSVALLYYLREGINRIGCGNDKKSVLMRLPSVVGQEQILKYHAIIECNVLQHQVTITTCNTSDQPQDMGRTEPVPDTASSPVSRGVKRSGVAPTRFSNQLKKELVAVKTTAATDVSSNNGGACGADVPDNIATVFVNGEPLYYGTTHRLTHNDRIVVGSLAFRHSQPLSWYLDHVDEFSRDPVTLDHVVLLESHERNEKEMAYYKEIERCIQTFADYEKLSSNNVRYKDNKMVEVMNKTTERVRVACANEVSALLYFTSETEQHLTENYPVAENTLLERQAARDTGALQFDYNYCINERDGFLKRKLQEKQNQTRDEQLNKLKSEAEKSEQEIEKLKKMLAVKEAEKAAERQREAEKAACLLKEKEAQKEKFSEASAKTNDLRLLANELQLFEEQMRSVTMWKPAGPLLSLPLDVEEYNFTQQQPTFAQVHGDGKPLVLPIYNCWKMRYSSGVLSVLRSGWHKVFVLVRLHFLYYFTSCEPKTIASGSAYLYGCEIRIDLAPIDGKPHTLRILPCIPRTRSKDLKGGELNNLLLAFDTRDELQSLRNYIESMYRPVCPPHVAEFLKHQEEKEKKREKKNKKNDKEKESK